MATSTNTVIQQLMDDTNAIDNNDPELEAKLQAIAEAVAREQQRIRPASTNMVNNAPVDPQDAFQCEGCQ